ncbi:MAG: hypothetical protein HOH74_02510 [Gemmatimonadetes bacterium]|nr:hypothetical protein [Gemmatimonadota bacterium]
MVDGDIAQLDRVTLARRGGAGAYIPFLLDVHPHPVSSPDDRWIAYVSGDARQTQISRRGSLANMVHEITKIRKVSMLWLFTLMLGLTTAADAEAGTRDVETEAHQLFTTIMSPYCPGSLLNQCPSSQAAVLRDEIRQRLRDGATREQIETELIATYGEGILASPPFSGFGVLSWLGAVGIFLGGLAAAGVWLRNRRGTDGSSPAPSTSSDDPLHKRMREEIDADDEI